MDMAAITGYEEAMEKVKDDHSRADNDLRNAESRIGELTNKLIDMNDDTREFNDTVKTIADLKIKKEVLQAKAARMQKAVEAIQRIPEVLTSKQAAIKNVEDQLASMERQKEAIEAKCKAMLEPVYDLATDYLRLQMEQGRIKRISEDRLKHRPTTSTNGYPASKLITLNDMEADSIIRQRYKSK